MQVQVQVQVRVQVQVQVHLEGGEVDDGLLAVDGDGDPVPGEQLGHRLLPEHVLQEPKVTEFSEDVKFL